MFVNVLYLCVCVCVCVCVFVCVHIVRACVRGGTQKNEIFSWAIGLFKELQKIH